MDKVPCASSCDGDDGSKKALKRKKTTNEEDSEYVPKEEAKGANQRVWSESDVIKLLGALKKQENVSDMKTLFQTVHPSLDANVTQKQVSDKVRKLKKKFMDSVGKEVVQDGVYKLSKQLWGGGGEKEEDKDENQDQDQDQDEEADEVDVFRANYPNVDHWVRRMHSEVDLSVIEFWTSIRGIALAMMDRLPQKELDEMEEQWNEYNLEGLERGNKRMKLMNKMLMLFDKYKI